VTLDAAHGVAGSPDPLTDEDFQLALFACYELHYGGLEGVDDRWEWDPGLIAARTLLEDAFETTLHELVPRVPSADEPVDLLLARLVAEDDGPSLSAYLARSATVDEWREFVVHRSAYHLKEADPHTWVIPRVTGRTKAAVVEIQADEYGGGSPGRMHCALFARVMRALELDDSYGAYVDRLPAPTLANVNAMSLFGLHRRWRGAILGHLAALEMTSTEPNRRYGAGLRRLGYGRDATLFYDEHVEADAVHEQIAAVDMCGSFVAEHPALLRDVLFGAQVALALDGVVASEILTRWRDERSSLLPVRTAEVPA
jgi:hypothetical protein